MTFPPPKNHIIEPADAAALTSRFREHHQGAVKGGLFPNDVYLRLIGQPGCRGIRIYYGEDETGSFTPVLCGVDESGNDMMPGTEQAGGGGNELMEYSYPCPPFCGDGNSLNGE